MIASVERLYGAQATPAVKPSADGLTEGAIGAPAANSTRSGTVRRSRRGEASSPSTHLRDVVLDHPLAAKDANVAHRACSAGKWAVLQAAHHVTDTVNMLARRSCVVVIPAPDVRRTAIDFSALRPESRNAVPQNVFVLSGPRLEYVCSVFGALCASVLNSTNPPLDAETHVARKMLGYAFVLLHASSAGVPRDAAPSTPATELELWDWAQGTGLHRGFDTVSLPAVTTRVSAINVSCGVVNLYPRMGGPAKSWPRGLPLTHALTSAHSCDWQDTSNVSSDDVVVVQVLEDESADVDGVFKLTRDFPFYFADSPAAKQPLSIGHGTLAPFNSRATIFLQRGFWSLFIPPAGRSATADILRAYVGERIMWDVQQSVAFVPPTALRLWTPMDDAAAAGREMLAQHKWSVIGEPLLRFLPQWSSNETATPLRLLHLYEELYRRAYVEAEDVAAVAAWIRTLHSLEYVWPRVRNAIELSPAKVQHDYCEARAARNLTFWTSDLHDGSRTDLPATLTAQGYSVVLAGIKGASVPYPIVLDSPLVALNSAGLCSTISDYRGMNDYVTEAMIRTMHDCYVKDIQMQRTDAIVCTFPSSFCEAFMSLNRTLVWWAIHRLGMARCTPARWNRHSAHVRAAYAHGHVISAANVYDAEYIHHFTGLRPHVIAGTSLWYTRRYQTRFTQARPEILIGPLQLLGSPELGPLTEAARGKYTFALAKVLYGRYELQNIADHRAVVVTPYAVMSWGLTELYALGIPIFTPERETLAHATIGDRRMTDIHYCPGMAVPPPDSNSRHAYDPESNAFVDSMYWLRYADTYTWPHVITYSSAEDLIRKLDSTDFAAVHAAMMRENDRRAAEVAARWRNVACRLEPNASIPPTYDEALHRLWGVARLQED